MALSRAVVSVAAVLAGAALLGVGAARPRAEEPARARALAPAFAQAPAPAPALAPAPAPTHRDAAVVKLSGGRGAWVTRETEPLVEPDTDPRPVTVAFHSICIDGSWTCDWFLPGELSPQWQLCPRGPIACGGGGYRWDANVADVRSLFEQSLAAVEERHGARVQRDEVVLLGYSNGAYAVAHLVHALAREPPPERIVGIVLFGADVRLAEGDVRALGARVGLTAGDYDGSSRVLRANAETLRRAGVETCFLSLGRMGHTIPQSTSRPIAQLVDWARGDAPCPPGA
jgi:predicted esterase